MGARFLWVLFRRSPRWPLCDVNERLLCRHGWVKPREKLASGDKTRGQAAGGSILGPWLWGAQQEASIGQREDSLRAAGSVELLAHLHGMRPDMQLPASPLSFALSWLGVLGQVTEPLSVSQLLYNGVIVASALRFPEDQMIHAKCLELWLPHSKHSDKYESLFLSLSPRFPCFRGWG